MATDLERLVVQLSADVKRFERELRRARATANKEMAAIEKRAKSAGINMSKNFSFVTGRTFLGQLSGLKQAIGGFGAALGIGAVRQYTDAWTNAENRLQAATQISGKQARSLDELNNIANATRSGIVETTNLYAKLLVSTRAVAKSEEEVARATELVNKAFRAGGATAGEQASGILQLGQALGSGKLAGDELKSISENAPLLAQAIADEFGTTIAGLRQLGEEGSLVTERVFKAILNGAPNIERAFGATTPTIESSITKLSNAVGQFIHNMDQAGQLTKSVVANVELIAKGLEQFNKTGKISDFFGIAFTIKEGGPLDSIIDNLNDMRDALAGLNAEQEKNNQIQAQAQASRDQWLEWLGAAAQFVINPDFDKLDELNRRYDELKDKLEKESIKPILDGKAIDDLKKQIGDTKVEIVAELVARGGGESVDDLKKQAADLRKQITDLNGTKFDINTGDAAAQIAKLTTEAERLEAVLKKKNNLRSITDLQDEIAESEKRIKELQKTADNAVIKLIPERELQQEKQRLAELKQQLSDTEIAWAELGDEGKQSSDEIRQRIIALRKEVRELQNQIAANKRMDADTAPLQEKLDKILETLRAIDAVTGSASEKLDQFGKTQPSFTPSEGAISESTRRFVEELKKARDAEAAKSDKEKSLEKAIEDLTQEIIESSGGKVTPSEARAQAEKELLASERSNLGQAEIDKFVEQVIHFESAGNPNAKNPLSTATGVGQFINSTWIDQFKKAFPAMWDDILTEMEAKFPGDRIKAEAERQAEVLKLRTDPTISTKLIENYAKENARALEAAGQQINAANLHLAHFLGPGGAVKVLEAFQKNPNTLVSSVLPDIISANPQLKGDTVQDLVAKMQAQAGLTTELTKAADANRKYAESFAELINNGNAEIERIKLETSLVGASNLERERQLLIFDKLNEARKLKQERDGANAKLGEEEIKQVTDIANAQARANDELATSAANAELAKDASEELTRQLADQAAKAQEAALETARAIGGAIKDSLKGFVHDLLEGKDATEALADALGNLADRLIDIAFDNIFNSLGGAGGIFGALFGGGGTGLLPGSGGVYKSGGYTGPAPTDAPAGIVHGQEFVVNAQATRKHRNLLEAINKGRVPKGYAKGGYVAKKGEDGKTPTVAQPSERIIVAPSHTEIHTQDSVSTHSLESRFDTSREALSREATRSFERLSENRSETNREAILREASERVLQDRIREMQRQEREAAFFESRSIESILEAVARDTERSRIEKNTERLQRLQDTERLSDKSSSERLSERLSESRSEIDSRRYSRETDSRSDRLVSDTRLDTLTESQRQDREAREFFESRVVESLMRSMSSHEIDRSRYEGVRDYFRSEAEHAYSERQRFEREQEFSAFADHFFSTLESISREKLDQKSRIERFHEFFKEYGFASGGYTGNKPTTQAAGVVHGKEFVVNAKATKKHRSLLEAINDGREEELQKVSVKGLRDAFMRMKGYQQGGYVTHEGDVNNSYLTRSQQTTRNPRYSSSTTSRTTNRLPGYAGGGYVKPLRPLALGATYVGVDAALPPLVHIDGPVVYPAAPGYAEGGYVVPLKALPPPVVLVERASSVSAQPVPGYYAGGYVAPLSPVNAVVPVALPGYADGGYVLPRMTTRTVAGATNSWGASNVSITVITPDAPSFLESQNQIAAKTNATLHRSMRTR